MKNLENSVLAFRNHKDLFDPTPFGFSHSVFVPSNGQFIFVAGQSGAEDLSHKLSNDFRTQVRFVFKNLSVILESYNLKPEHVIKFTILIVDHDEEKFRIYLEEAKKFWKDDKYPIGTLIPVPKLAVEGMMIEIDVIAYQKL